tara:strand:- start:211 stop:477 length:267 start_codon:yes stop_codon:yes gene_type:complete
MMKKFDTDGFMTKAKKVLGAKSENRKNALVVVLEVGYQQRQNIKNFAFNTDGYDIICETLIPIDTYKITLLCPTEEKANELRTISEGW